MVPGGQRGSAGPRQHLGTLQLPAGGQEKVIVQLILGRCSPGWGSLDSHGMLALPGEGPEGGGFTGMGFTGMGFTGRN